MPTRSVTSVAPGKAAARSAGKLADDRGSEWGGQQLDQRCVRVRCCGFLHVGLPLLLAICARFGRRFSSVMVVHKGDLCRLSASARRNPMPIEDLRIQLGACQCGFSMLDPGEALSGVCD